MNKVALKFVLSICLIAAAASLQAATCGLPEQMVPSALGVNIHFSSQDDDQVAQLAEAGFRFIRMDMCWSEVEQTKGVYNFDAYDGLMSSLDKKGIRPLFILDYANPLYDEGEAPNTPGGRTAFAAFASAAARHFKDRGVIWEIWNEPDIKTFWKPEPNPENYTRMASAAAEAIRAADPSAKIAGPATVGVNLSFIEKCCAYGLLKYVDAVSVHPSRETAPETVISEYQQLKDVIGRYTPKGKEISIISSKWGYSTINNSEDEQAQFAVRMFLVNLMSDVNLSIWYDWRDNGTDPADKQHHFGAVYSDLKPKPAYDAIKTLTSELDQCKFAARLSSKKNEYVLLFKGPSGYRIAAWTTGEEHEVTLPIDNPEVSMVAMNGDTSEIRPTGGKLTFNVSQSPVYLIVGKSERLSLEESIKLKTGVDKRWKLQDVITAVISNPLTKPIKGSLTMTLFDKNTLVKSFDLAAGKSETFKFEPKSIWDGRTELTAETAIAIDGLDTPIVRSLDLGITNKVSASPACPLSRVLEFRIVNPTPDKIKGKVRLLGVKGIKPKSETIKFEVENQTVVGFTLEEPAPREFSFGYELVDVTGKIILRSPVLNYSIIEDFSSVTDGAPLNDYQISLLDGREKTGTVMADAYKIDTPYTSLPKIATCRLRYELKDGGLFVLTPNREMPLSAKPVAVGMWIRGDGTGEVACCRFVDANGQIFQPNGFKVDWNGWRYKVISLDKSNCKFWGGRADGNPVPPYKWDSIFLLDTAGKEARGTIYIGPMMLVSEQ